MRPALLNALLSIVLVATVAGCTDDAVDCSLIGAPSGPMFLLRISNADTKGPAWFGSSAWIHDGAFQEVLVPLSTDPADSALSIAVVSQSQRPGVYTVRVERDGFVPWVVEGIEVVERGCFLSSHLFDVALDPAP